MRWRLKALQARWGDESGRTAAPGLLVMPTRGAFGPVTVSISQWSELGRVENMSDGRDSNQDERDAYAKEDRSSFSSACATVGVKTVAAGAP